MDISVLPPVKGHCPECAMDHDPSDPHDLQSIYYRTRFAFAHGRDATWADALAHCPKAVRERRTAELAAHGVRVGTEAVS